MNSNLTITLVFLCIKFLSSFIVSAEYVPVFMWETTKTTISIPALDKISEDSFKDLLLERLGKNPYLVVFVEHNLSPEDFIQRGQSNKTPYSHLSIIKTRAKVSYWPFVQRPVGSIKQLDKKIIEVSASSLLKDFNVPKNHILIVNLNDAKDDENRYEMLKRHDSNINTIYNRLLDYHDNILALYTAHHTSWVMPEEIRSQRHARNLLAENINEPSTTLGPKLFNETYAIVYLNSSAFYINESIKVDLVSYSADTSYDNNTININFSLTEKDPSFRFVIEYDKGYWYLSTIVVTEGTTDKKEYNLKVRDVYAPDKFSYHCTSAVYYGANSTQSLSLPGFQIQPLPNGTYTPFGDAYDCVGFTSAPIWSGIFVTFILVLIMTAGLTVMMDIKTMDRFDDPKGKTISINVSE